MRAPEPREQFDQSWQDADAFSLGQIIDELYRLDAVVGVGMMGKVYRATRITDGAQLAIKFMTSSPMVEDDISRARFQREARAISKLKHDHILELFSFGQAMGRPYLATEYVVGGDLHQLLNQRQLLLDEIGHLLSQVGSALDYAHSQQVIHRDIKPANILLDENGWAVLADFGLARLEEFEGTLTDAGILVGTPAYMAPELAGEARLTPSVDLYALACILYQMLTAQLPFQSDTTAGYLMQHLAADRPDVRSIRPELPEGLTYVLRRALARDVSERYPAAAALHRAYLDALAGKTLVGAALPTLVDKMPELVESPFKGLEAFQEEDAPYFFGREPLVRQLIERLSKPDTRFLAVLGASGSGKSSLVRAGLIPALRKHAITASDDWPILIFTPGAQPVEALANSLHLILGMGRGQLVGEIEQNPDVLAQYIKLLASRQANTDHARVVLFIDQFEEVFTRASDATRKTFLDAIIRAATEPHGAAVIVLTMRADFYHHVTSYPDARLIDLFQYQQVIARTMTPGELRHAIEAPAETVGLEFESGLVETILADIGQEPGSLPLLQYGLQELFQNKRGLTLTRQAYQMTGGVMGALARRAEDIYAQLDKPQQVLMRRILLRLVEVSEEGEITRRRIDRDQLTFDNTPDEAVEDILDRLTTPQVRLLTANREWQTGRQWIDVSHEALIRQWERLQLWVRENLGSLLLGGQILQIAYDWEKAERDQSYLLRGARLDEALKWVTSAEADVFPAQRELISASVSVRESEEAQKLAQQQHEIMLERARAVQAERVQRQLRVMLVGAILFTIVAVTLAVIAANESERARRTAREVQSLALAQSAEKAAEEHSPDLALALALEAVSQEQPPVQAQQTLSELADSVGTVRRITGHTDWVSSVVYSPDGKTALSGSFDGTLELWDVATAKALRIFNGHTDHVSSVALSPDGQTALSGSWDATLILWDIKTGQQIRRMQGHRYAVSSVAFSPDGKTAVSGSWDNSLILWDVAAGKEIRRFEGHTDRVSSVAFSPDGKTIASGALDESIRLWDVEQGTETRRLQDLQRQMGKVLAVAFNTDGTLIAGAGEGRTVVVWDAANGQAKYRLAGHTNKITALTFNVDGRILASGSSDYGIRLWSMEDGTLLRQIYADNTGILALTYAKDGKTLISGDEANNLRLWDVEVHRLTGHTLSVSSVVFSPDGKLALSGSADTTLIIWNVDNGTIVSRLEGHEDVVENAVFSPDGKTVLSAADDSLVIQWDVATGKEIKRFEGHTDWVANIIVSPDGKLAFSGSGSPEADKSVIVWDVATGKEVRRLEGHTDTVSGLAITKDGKTLITGSWDNSVGVWDAATGKEVLRITGHKDKVWNVALSPDGKTVMSASLDHTLRLWDLATGNELRRFVGHTGGVTSVAMSPDGKTALSGGEDRTVRLWDVATGREIRRFEGHTAKIWSVVYSPDGQIALSASEDKTVRQWRISRSLDELRTWIGVNRFVRTLTCEERETYRLDNPTSHPCAANAVAMVSIPASALTSTPIRGRAVQIGLNRGRIDIGGAETWTYSAQAGEAIMISVKADKAANETTDRERRERGLLDVRVIVRDAAGNVIAEGDDTVTETFRTTDAMLERLEFSTAGVYEIEVRSFGNEMGGGYTLLIGSAPEPTATPAP